jgi:anaerobic selenocysteine-containing dehydrogenase
MNRRKFLSRIIAGAAGTTAVGLAATNLGTAATSAKENHVVTWQVLGFTCITCATGLEVMLLQQKGVARARASASYPEAKVIIGFNDRMTSEETLRKFIAGCGFSVS